jgi:hypothetical protein
LFHDFHAIGGMELLKLLTAIFYRSKKSAAEINDLNTFDGDLRKAYNVQHLNCVPKLSNMLALLVCISFFASFQSILLMLEYCGRSARNRFSILFESNAEQPLVMKHRIGMIVSFSIAESGAFGNMEQVQTPISGK